MAWGYARSSPTKRKPIETVAPVASNAPTGSLPFVANEKDVRGPSSPAEKSSSGRLIDALRHQIAQSPVLQDADAQSSLLDSLDRAGDLWTKTQRQNRDALRQLKRQVRIGESRQAPHLVLITFDRSNSTRNGLFADLAHRGVNFTQHYAGGESTTSGWWTLMTGRNTGRARTDESRFELRDSEPTIATALWQAGYATGFLGVWPTGVAPLDGGFDGWTGLHGTSENTPLFPNVLQTGRTRMTIGANANDKSGASLWKLLNVEVESFIADHAGHSRPFYLQVRLPNLVSEQPPALGDTPENVVEQMFASLKKAGIENRTCVVITALAGSESPNAMPLCDTDLRVPLVMIGAPDTASDTKFDEPSAAWDLLPTMLDLAKATRRSANSDGRSLVPVTNGRSGKSERLLYWESDRVGHVQAVRKGDWKGTANASDRQLRLYHLPTDPAEEKNVADDHPHVVKELLAPPAPKEVSTTRATPSGPT